MHIKFLGVMKPQAEPSVGCLIVKLKTPANSYISTCTSKLCMRQWRYAYNGFLKIVFIYLPDIILRNCICLKFDWSLCCPVLVIDGVLGSLELLQSIAFF